MLHFLDFYGRKNKILRLQDFKKSESQIKEEYIQKNTSGIFQQHSQKGKVDISKFVRIGSGED